MKDNSLNIHKKESDNKIHEKKLNISPKISQKNFFDEFLLSPAKGTTSQKFFTSKDNYFGEKASPLCSISPKAHSPILNSYSGLSPLKQNINYYSPKIKKENFTKINRNNSSKISPNFNTSPSAIFNAVESSINNNNNQAEDDTKTLQEKIASFVKMENMNNINNNNSQKNINIYLNEENDDSDEDNDDIDADGQGAFYLSFHIKEKNNLESIEQSQDKNSKMNINQNSNLNNTNNNNINENKNNLSDQNSVKTIINNKNYTPYIPNKLRKNQNDIINTFDFDNNNNSYYQNNNFEQIPPNFNNKNNINSVNQIKINEPPKSINDTKINNDNKINFIENIKDQSKIQSDSHNFFYNGDNYQISNTKKYKKEDYKKTGKIPLITPSDIVITITSNNKVVKRINPNIYLNESVEFLAFNIFPLAQDQAGCRYLQEMVEKDPLNTVPIFFKSLIPYLIALIKDPFGNYFVQKLFPYLTFNDFKFILEKIELNIFDLSSNQHGTRVIQNIIFYLKTPELSNMFFNMIKPHIIPLLKEMHGAHIINKLVNLNPRYSNEINKIILNNCCSLATNRHGCCFLQKIMESPDSSLKNELIKNLIDNIFVLIIDQFGNYVIQSILLLNNNKYASAIVLKIADSTPYYSKHRYSSNVIEKCFDFCGKNERNILINKLYSPEIISELILDEHGNYVIQKALYYADYAKKEEMLKILRTLIPKIRNSSFGNKLLTRLLAMYPTLGNNRNINDNDRKNNNNNKYQYNWNNYYNNNINYNNNYKNKNYTHNYNDGFQHKNNYDYNNLENNYINRLNNNNIEDNASNINSVNINKDIINNSDINNNSQDINNNVSLNKYFNIINNTINININSNQDENEDNKNIEKNNFNYNNQIELDLQKKIQKKKGRNFKKNNEE